ncbi:MAG: adenosine monophosphate-protein transferase, partial [Bartonella sp.]|nr:adenosine monophosphate-protein transferase [Bartonella sp.]
ITVKLPSAPLQDILNSPKGKQKQLLSDEKFSSVIKQELKEFMTALNARLSPSEHKNIYDNNYQKLAKSIGISENKAAKIITVAQQAKELSQQIQTQVLNLEK